MTSKKSSLNVTQREFIERWSMFANVGGKFTLDDEVRYRFEADEFVQSHVRLLHVGDEKNAQVRVDVDASSFRVTIDAAFFNFDFDAVSLFERSGVKVQLSISLERCLDATEALVNLIQILCEIGKLVC